MVIVKLQEEVEHYKDKNEQLERDLNEIKTGNKISKPKVNKNTKKTKESADLYKDLSIDDSVLEDDDIENVVREERCLLQRGAIIALHRAGHSNVEIARMAQCSVRYVQIYILRYSVLGTEGLMDWRQQNREIPRDQNRNNSLNSLNIKIKRRFSRPK